MRINPLLAKELRLQMRTWRTFAILALYLLVLGGFGALFFASMAGNLRMGYMDTAHLGQSMFIFLAILQYALIVLLVPGLTASAISGEKERQTFELLVSTQLTPLGIVLGKLTAALSTVFLLILSSLPLYGFVFLLGGISPGELVSLMIILMVTALLFASITVILSASMRKTTMAFIASYGVIAFILGGTLLLNAINVLFFQRGIVLPLHYLLYFNPLVLFESIYPQELQSLLAELSQHAYPFSKFPWLRFWQINLLVDALLALFNLSWAARLVNPLQGNGKKFAASETTVAAKEE